MTCLLEIMKHILLLKYFGENVGNIYQNWKYMYSLTQKLHFQQFILQEKLHTQKSVYRSISYSIVYKQK